MSTSRPARRDLKGLRILLVEDSPDIRDAFEVLLTAEGADVAATAAGRQALELVRRREFDVVLTDLGLPDVPGEILIRGIIAAASNHPRIVVVTGYGEPYTSNAARAGADTVLTKPVEWTVLLQELAVAPVSEAAVA